MVAGMGHHNRACKAITRSDLTVLVTRLWRDSTKSWLESDSNRRNFKWLWLNFDSMGLWLFLDFDSAKITRAHHWFQLLFFWVIALHVVVKYKHRTSLVVVNTVVAYFVLYYSVVAI